MYLKLALRNIRRSVRDYAVYFITLLFGVAVFYAFNSIGSQQILFDMETSASRSVFASTTYILGMFSIVVACVLGFLILYANQFLIRRRKREFGTYLVLGMTPGHVSRIVLYETVLVGVLSLAVGLLCGVLLSQALSFFTAALFGTTMTNYQFVFSPDAFLVTLACFAAIYVVVALFNTITVSRCKLIDLIRAGEKNEREGVRNPWVCLVVFVASIAILAYAYEQLIENGLVMMDQPEFLRATVGMLVGSLLFFWSLAGFAVAVLTRLRGAYLRKLNLFTVRQIASKVNTAFLSLWAVCVLLFFSITVFSSGMGLVEVFVGGAERSNPYSASLDAGVWYGPDGSTTSSSGDPLERRAEMEEGAPDRLAQAESFNWDMAAAPSVTIAGETYELEGPLYDTQLEDNAMAATALVVIAPDEAVNALKAAGCIPDTQYLNVMYADNGKTASENDAALDDIVAALQPRDMGGFEKGTQGADDPYASLLWPVTRILTANEMLSQSAGLRLMITYLALYIGFVFLISTAAILAIQQLSQTSDSAPRYRILWKLGCDRGMINRSLLAQVLVYFLVPLGLAVCHSVCAIGVLSDSLLDAIGVSSAGPIMMAAALTLVIYGGYMLVTYLAARGIVKGSLMEG